MFLSPSSSLKKSIKKPKKSLNECKWCWTRRRQRYRQDWYVWKSPRKHPGNHRNTTGIRLSTRIYDTVLVLQDIYNLIVGSRNFLIRGCRGRCMGHILDPPMINLYMDPVSSVSQIGRQEGHHIGPRGCTTSAPLPLCLSLSFYLLYRQMRLKRRKKTRRRASKKRLCWTFNWRH
jgi:hypothetical protein